MRHDHAYAVTEAKPKRFKSGKSNSDTEELKTKEFSSNKFPIQ